MRNCFKDHPASVGETYFQHMSAALGFAARLFRASVACFVHGMLPFLFTRTGSSAVRRLYEDMITERPHKEGGEPTTAKPR